jgi:dCMP deaminase
MSTKWDHAHMITAETYAQLSSARRAQVGCVIVKDNRIVSIGYNGMPSGWDNNCENEIKWPDGTIQFLETKAEVLHAEANAITKVARSTENCEDSTLYTTMLPCLDCAKLIYQAGITRVVYRDSYPKGTAGLEFLDKCNILVEQYVKSN